MGTELCHIRHRKIWSNKMKKCFFIFLLPFIIFACNKNANTTTEQQNHYLENIKNGAKVTIYYNSPYDWPDTGRTLKDVKNGKYIFNETYNLSEFEIPKIDCIFSEEKLVEAENADDRLDIILLGTMMRAETLFEILDDNDSVLFNYLYFATGKFILYGEDKVYYKTDEIEDFSKKVIERACKDNGKLVYLRYMD